MLQRSRWSTWVVALVVTGLWLAAPVVWTGLELARAHVMTGFMMGSLAHTQAKWPLVIQIADLFGEYGVDFVMVLGIREPGRSGQQMCPEALDVVATVAQLRGRYKYEVMFDGGVKTTNVADIPARYIVAASAVLCADNPIQAASVIRSASSTGR